MAKKLGIDGGISQQTDADYSGKFGTDKATGPFSRLSLSGGIVSYARTYEKEPTIGTAYESEQAFAVADGSDIYVQIYTAIDNESAFELTPSEPFTINSVSSSYGTDIIEANATLTVNVTDSTNVTLVTVNGVLCSLVQIINATQVTAEVPLGVLADYGSTVDVVVNNGTASPAYQAEIRVPQGMVETDFTVDYANLSPDSPYANNANYQDIVTGDSAIYDQLTQPDSITVTMDGLGDYTLSSNNYTAPQTFDHYIWDTSDDTPSAEIKTITVQPGPISVTIGLASEEEDAYSLSAIVVVSDTINTAYEAETAFDVTDGSDVTDEIATALESEQAFSVSGGPEIIIEIGTASETESAYSVIDGSEITVEISTAFETEQAYDVFDASSIFISIDTAYEAETAFSILEAASFDSLQAQINALQLQVSNLQEQVTLLQTQNNEMYIALDLDNANPNTYAEDGSSISNNLYTLTKSDNGDGTFTVVKS